MRGYVIHRHKKGLVSFLIRIITGSWTSHTGVILESWGTLFVIEADKGSVIATPLNYWVKDCKYVLQNFHLTGKQLEHLSILAMQKCGTPYDYKNTVLQQLIKRLFGVWTGNSKGFAASKFNCSEFTAWLLNQVGIKFENWEQITPGEILKDKRGTII